MPTEVERTFRRQSLKPERKKRQEPQRFGSALPGVETAPEDQLALDLAGRADWSRVASPAPGFGRRS
jgi:hypothetical protein